MAFLDTIGIASILPFMSVLTNPSLIETNFILNTMFQISQIFGVKTYLQFLFFLGAAAFILLIVSLVFKALTIYLQVRFIQMCEYAIGKRLVEGYLHQHYSWFLSRNSADLGKIILSEVQEIISGGMAPLMQIITSGMVAIFLITILIIANPKLTLVIGLLLACMYMLIFYFLQNYIKRLGTERLKNNRLRFTAVSEAFGASKEIKVGGFEEVYIKIFSKASQIFARTHTAAKLISQLPRFILEAIIFGSILLIILYFMDQAGSFNNAIPVLSLYIFAGYRLVPALNVIYSSSTSITFIVPSLNKLHDDFKSFKSFNKEQDRGILSLNAAITLKNINYSYPNSPKKTLQNISLTIPVKSHVAFIGATGSGKTTLVDIILGLLEPQQGTLEIDGKIITNQNLRSWQRSIGYVPQHIYLSDDTIAANIAFGVELKDIDQNIVEKSSKISNLHEFVINELPKKYQTIIGERGVRLSGGQRQRIGIARALYRNPKILILDEATSALDIQTEKAVMDAINNLDKNITIILIAHRLGIVKNFNKIFLLEKGKLKNEGTFEELKIINENFYLSANT
jgi:ABC-type multidrug transport system fused ATPase/permease subunit